METKHTKMTPQQAAEYRERYRQATAPATGRFDHWPTPELKAQHEQDLATMQADRAAGRIPF